MEASSQKKDNSRLLCRIQRPLFYFLMVVLPALIPLTATRMEASLILLGLFALVMVLYIRPWKYSLLFVGLALLLYWFSRSFLPLGLLFGTVLAISVGAFYLNSSPERKHLSPWTILAPVLTFLLSWLLTGSLLWACFSVCIYPAVYILHETSFKENSRFASLCVLSFGVLFLGMAAGFVYCLQTYHAVNLNVTKQAFEAFRESVYRELVTAYSSIDSVITAQRGQTLFASANAEQASLLSYTVESFSNSLTTALFNYIPALLVLVCGGTAFLAQVAFLRLFPEKTYAALPEEQRRMILSPYAALFYVLWNIVLFIASVSGSEFVTVASMNLVLVLFPPFLFFGLREFFLRVRRATAGRKVFYLIFFFALLIFAFSYSFLLFALSGALSTLVYHLMKRIRSRFGDNSGNPPVV